MNRNWFKPVGVLALAVSLFVAGCDASPTGPTAPAQEVSQQQPTTAEQNRAAVEQSFSQFNGPISSIIVDDQYHIVQATPSSLLGATNLLGFLGGTLNVGGHKLQVQTGSVLSPTLFTMVRLPSPTIQVSLTAITGTLFNLLNIGEQGFNEPVKLTLSYSNAIGVTDPSRLRIAELKWNGTLGEVLPTSYNATNKTVTAYLPHFSSWIVVCD